MILASVQAYKEDRHGSEAWKNRAAFTTATSLFRENPRTAGYDRYVHLTVTHIVSVDDVSNCEMYVEVLAELHKASG